MSDEKRPSHPSLAVAWVLVPKNSAYDVIADAATRLDSAIDARVEAIVNGKILHVDSYHKLRDMAVEENKRLARSIAREEIAAAMEKLRAELGPKFMTTPPRPSMRRKRSGASLTARAHGWTRCRGMAKGSSKILCAGLSPTALAQREGEG